MMRCGWRWVLGGTLTWRRRPPPARLRRTSSSTRWWPSALMSTRPSEGVRRRAKRWRSTPAWWGLWSGSSTGALLTGPGPTPWASPWRRGSWTRSGRFWTGLLLGRRSGRSWPTLWSLVLGATRSWGPGTSACGSSVAWPRCMLPSRRRTGTMLRRFSASSTWRTPKPRPRPCSGCWRAQRLPSFWRTRSPLTLQRARTSPSSSGSWGTWRRARPQRKATPPPPTRPRRKAPLLPRTQPRRPVPLRLRRPRWPSFCACFGLRGSRWTCR
mmetsp:Transcript_10180/g.29062  ORF Transcript_10180/g.29062 Transcript_10180/m.29062 type:complete len:269 (+) Transcript_10180:300-1106(+)